MITGYPSAGKTTVATKMKEDFEKRIAESDEHKQMKVELINDELLNIKKEEYRDGKTEKMLRGNQISAVKRALGKNTIVILDNLTYIKGFRYQLYCDAKTCMTNSCVVHVGASAEKCKELNNERGDDAWEDKLFDALVFRYEEPNGMSRWDSPLFTIPLNDELPMDELWQVLVLNKPKPPNKSTLLNTVKPTNYMSELDRVTTSVLNAVMESYKQQPGGNVKILNHPEPIELPMRLSLPQMNRYRRNFVSLNKMHPTEISRIEPLFIEFLTRQWDDE